MAVTQQRPLIAINCDAFPDPGIPITGVRAPYIQAVLAAGGTPFLIPFLEDKQQVDQILSLADGVVLTGGDDLPAHRVGGQLHPSARPVIEARDTGDFLLIAGVHERGIPTLAICLGFQQLNIHLGGTIYQDLPDEFPQGIAHGHPGAGFAEHPISVLADTALSSIWKGAAQVTVNSGHHQAIKDLGGGLRRGAVSSDGLIEAAELVGHPFLVGVQWHPERMAEDWRQRALFEELIRKAGQ